ncbi:MAG: twin-arginine translocase TatA/TatE family subunit [Candidatus Marinimicrobia bacterium]|nr:twin-arginine translocase TatA/TatE family subunit [Candidatus Neomarinimicrobiota bacterium]MCF7850692.1 twin-arginine translocase TatA/TatE family subunit [Candidatus Neomarinimicrobiota bacterium]
MSLPGGWEWLIIILFILIFFGAKRLPEMAKGLGKGIREFKGALSGITDEIEKAGEAPAEPKPKPEESKEEAKPKQD